MFNKILIVCLGNICRSPMGEAILKHRLATSKTSIQVSSAGLAALVGREADPFVKEILLAKGIDCSAHKGRQLTSAILLESDLVLVMDQHQRKEIERTFPSSCGKVHLLGKWGNFEIPDPYKKPKSFFEDTYHLISSGVDQWRQKLWN